MNVTVESLKRGRQPLSWGEVVEGLCTDPSMADELTTRVLRSGHRGVFFETSPVRGDSRDVPFRFVVLPGPDLDERPADPDAFAEHFGGSEDPVLRFPNLSRSALLVVPRPNRDDDPWGHLAAFLRSAPEALARTFWRKGAEAVRHWLHTRPTRPVWWSTAGSGVPWLHLRLDETPKYYRYRPFRTAPAAPLRNPESPDITPLPEPPEDD